MSEFGRFPLYQRYKRVDVDHVETTTLNVDRRAVHGSPVSVILIDQRKIDEGILDTVTDPTKLYLIDGHLDISGHTIIVPVEGLMIQGYGFNVSSLTTTTDNAEMFSSPVGGSGDLLFTDIAFTASGVGAKVFALTDVDGTHAIECQRVNYNGCTSLGYMDGYRQGLEQGTGRFGGTPDLEFRGTWAGGFFLDTTIVRGVEDSTYSLFKCAVGQTFASRFATNANILVPANVTAFEMAEANFLFSELLQINGAQFSGTGVVLSGIDETSERVRVSNSRGIKNTFVGAYWTCDTPIETDIEFSDTFYKILGTTTAANLEWFSSSGDNIITSLSGQDVQVIIGFTGSFQGGQNKEFEIVFRIWDDSEGVYVESSKLDFSTDGNGNYSNLTFSTPRQTINLNDRIEVWLKNTSDSTNITMQVHSQLRVTEV